MSISRACCPPALRVLPTNAGWRAGRLRQLSLQNATGQRGGFADEFAPAMTWIPSVETAYTMRDMGARL
jgi:hypothetical protein